MGTSTPHSRADHTPPRYRDTGYIFDKDMARAKVYFSDEKHVDRFPNPEIAHLRLSETAGASGVDVSVINTEEKGEHLRQSLQIKNYYKVRYT